MVNVNKMSKEDYVNHMISLVDENKIKETWEEFKIKFEKLNPKIKCDFWIDFMELDDADLNDLDILGSLDKQVLEFVINSPRIVNKEVMNKIDRKVNAKIPDHIQIDIEGYTGCIDGDTFIEVPRDLKKYPLGIKIKNLINKKDFYVYTLNKYNGNLELQKCKRVWKTGRKKVYEITTITGRKIIATENHKFLINMYSETRITNTKFSNFKIIGREYKELKELKLGDKLIIFRRSDEEYPRIKINFDSGFSKSIAEHRFITEKLYNIDNNKCVHHKDHNTKNNSINNLEYGDFSPHLKYHTLKRKYYGKKLWMKKGHPKGMLGKHHNNYQVGKFKNKKYFIPNHNYTKTKEFSDSVKKGVKIGLNKFRKSKHYKIWLKKISKYNSKFEKIISIKELGIRNVYDMEVEKNHNFFANGICIHNSGKSTFMRALASHFFPNFKSDSVYYLKKDLLEAVTEIEETDDKRLLVLDEDVLSKGIGSVRAEDDLTQLFESCRKARLSYIGCHAIAKHDNQTTFYRFFVFANNKERRITTALVYRMNICIGFLVMRIPYTQKFFEIEYEYEQRKNEFIRKTLKNENVETIDVTGCAKKVLNDVEMQMLKSRNLLNKKALKTKVYELYNSYTIGEQDMIVTKAFNLYLMAGNECDDYEHKETN